MLQNQSSVLRECKRYYNEKSLIVCTLPSRHLDIYIDNRDRGCQSLLDKKTKLDKVKVAIWTDPGWCLTKL